MTRNNYDTKKTRRSCEVLYIISGHFPARQITRPADYCIYGKKKKKKGVSTLPSLLDNRHLKSKENLYKKDTEYTNLKENQQLLFCKFKLLCMTKQYMVIVLFSIPWSKDYSTTPGPR